MNKSIIELSNLLKKKKISSLELTKIYLKKIKNSKLNTFININKKKSIKDAKKADKIIYNKNNTILTGIPIAHKDIFVTKYNKTTAGSKFLKKYISPYDSFIIKKFNKFNMINLGKLNCDEFAIGSDNSNSYFKKVINYLDKLSIPGGSSGGSASAVSANLIPAATASDTGGSIIQPCSLCGVTGIKPTYGRISRFGMISFASSLDQAGIISNNAEDCGILLSIISGFDKNDNTSLNKNFEYFNKNLNKSLEKTIIGLPIEFFNQGLSIKIENKINDVIKIYKKLGVKFIDISLKKNKISNLTYDILSSIEVMSNLSRYDGIKYGKYNKKKKFLKNLIYNRNFNLGKEVKKRILKGLIYSSSKYYKNIYSKSLKFRYSIYKEYYNFFNNNILNCNAILIPIFSDLGYNIKSKNINNKMNDIFTISTNLSGLPSISIPCGYIKNKIYKKKNISFQIIGNYYKENKILNIAHKYQNFIK
ncbi:putative glutamyl-tRNA(Gln) amidotransferase, A subunit [Candidatus Zinderia insecticola CARI]|uniref:Putative glutamyl-tRNA(Gln) amidotransferase, A subunit n=1 Tax=Zinderia insecticola (strain CARI) TaxID=871271 RepID=E0TIZ5_ZINIC|nr:putative glutamyl-tRNA(Gln) amidotransferase, A subunit [Candidatus Zinderia insecticola CARI]